MATRRPAFQQERQDAGTFMMCGRLPNGSRNGSRLINGSQPTTGTGVRDGDVH
jgi:hypothetical protein